MTELYTEPMSSPLVTIVCVTYNQEIFIRDALESFVTQVTDFPFQVLISDDASTDSTSEIIKEYEKMYGNIIKPIYRKQNLGAAHNFIYTLQEVRTKYVIYNEGDDYFSSPYKLQMQVDFLEANPECAMCFHPATIQYLDGSKPDDVFPSSDFRFGKIKLNLEDLLIHNFIQTNSVMYRWRFTKEDFKDNISASILPGDWYLHLLHAQKGAIGFLDEVMSVYRKHPGGLWWAGQAVDKFQAKYSTEVFSFYYEVYSNIINNDENYYRNKLVPVFYALVHSIRVCNEPEKLIGIFEKYPKFAVEQFLDVQQQSWGVLLKPTPSIKAAIKQKLKKYRVIQWMYVKYKRLTIQSSN